MKKNETEFKSGFIAIIGAPNVGKSTLLNRMLGEKISIVSKKPQTTRNRILGVVHRPASQLIFLDTPGVHKAKKALNRFMVETAVSAIGDVDIILFMLDISNPDPESEKIVTKVLKDQKKPVILVLNKIDRIKKPQLLSIIKKWSEVLEFKTVIPISAKHGTQMDDLMETMEEMIPPGPQYYPEDTLTDVPERFIVAEMVREKIFRFTGQEIPYSTAVTIDAFEENSKKNLVKIQATIHVEHDSQKGVIIGKGGTKLKQIGQEARLEIEKMLNVKVFLKLFVRVQKNWSRDTRALRKLGYQ